MKFEDAIWCKSVQLFFMPRQLFLICHLWLCLKCMIVFFLWFFYVIVILLVPNPRVWVCDITNISLYCAKILSSMYFCENKKPFQIKNKGILLPFPNKTYFIPKGRLENKYLSVPQNVTFIPNLVRHLWFWFSGMNQAAILDLSNQLRGPRIPQHFWSATSHPNIALH